MTTSKPIISVPSIALYVASCLRRLRSIYSHRLSMAYPRETMLDTFQHIARKFVTILLPPRRQWRLQEHFENSSTHMTLSTIPSVQIYCLPWWLLTDELVSPGLPGRFTGISKILYAVAGDAGCCLP